MCNGLNTMRASKIDVKINLYIQGNLRPCLQTLQAQLTIIQIWLHIPLVYIWYRLKTSIAKTWRKLKRFIMLLIVQECSRHKDRHEWVLLSSSGKSFAYTRICYQKMAKERNAQEVPLAMNENDLSTLSNKKKEMKNVIYLCIFEILLYFLSLLC